MEWASIFISVFALAVAATTLWITYFRKGEVRMTKPTLIFFGPDNSEENISKVFLRTLLYSTSKRGTVLENLYVRLRRGETQQNFSIWVYGETNLARGSGLFVGPDGVATNHHFLTPTDVKSFAFDKGEYQVDVFVKIVGESDVKLLSTIELKIEETEAAKLRETGYGIFFDWGPDSGRYQAHIDQRPNSEMDPVLLLEALHRGVRDLPQSPEEPAKD